MLDLLRVAGCVYVLSEMAGKGGRLKMPTRRMCDRQKEVEYVSTRHHGAAMGCLVDLPVSDIIHMPNTPYKSVLCPDFNVAEPVSSCRFGSMCRLIHADTSRERVSQFHINFAWRCLEEVTYKRFPGGSLIEVSLPRGGNGDVMNSNMMLETKAMKNNKGQSHCAHYYYNRKCALGDECRFVHAVYIDPSAADHELAPSPVQIGRFVE
jgi:hypothetical protein